MRRVKLSFIGKSKNRGSVMKIVIAGLLIKDGCCLIAKRHAGDSLANLWEFPGGKLESGETHEACLYREMQEELQIQVAVGSFFAENSYEYEFGVFQLFLYWATWQSGVLYPAVHDEIAWVTKETILNYEFVPADIPIVEKLRCCDNW